MAKNLPQEIVAEIDNLPDHARMRTLFITLALVGFGCGDDGTKPAIDAAPPVVDAAPDAAPVVALDCPTYCTQIQTNCTGTNGQYSDMAHCLGSCATFVVGTSKVTDTSGNTLGCRIYHGGAPAKADAVLHCPHAGPAGDKIAAGAAAFCNGTDACTNFCTLQIKTCGSTAAPVTVGGTAIVPQYADLAACVNVCKNGDAAATPPITAFDLTHLYGTTSAGNSLACKLNHWTNAASFAAATPPNAANVQLHCNHTAPQPTGPCAGVAAP